MTSCGASDTVDNIVFECGALVDARKALRNLVEAIGLPWPCGLQRLVGTLEVWKEFRSSMQETVVLRCHMVGRPKMREIRALMS